MTQPGAKASTLSGIGMQRAKEARLRERAKGAIGQSGWPKISDQIRLALGQCHGQTATTLAGHVGVSSDQLRAFLRGESGLRLAALDRICRWLGVSLCDADGAELPVKLKKPR